MKEKLKAHFLNIGPRRFVILTIILLAATDIINSYYLKIFWVKKNLSQTLVNESIRRGQMAIEDFSIETLQEMAGFVDNAFYFFLMLILVNNYFFYFFYFKKKLWAQGYVLFYALTAALMSGTFMYDNAGLGAGWFAYNLLMIPFYIYLFLGVKLLKAETILVPEKKGR